MTEYQKIENELLRLGWTAQQGKGDHIKFRKEGVAKILTVPRSIAAQGRALDNTLAKIRQMEPAFTLGRPASGKDAAATDLTQEQIDGATLPPGTPPWIHPGASVRWTNPEGRNWALLNDSGALMNQRYIVQIITRSDRPDPNVTIQDANRAHDPFTVPAAELDTWKTEDCSECGKTLPENIMLHKNDGTPICQQCLSALAKAAEKKTLTPESNSPYSNREYTALKQAQDRMHLLSEKYKDVKLGDIPEKERNEMYQEYKKIIDKLPSKMRKEMINSHPELAVIFNDSPRTYTPYECWKRFLTSVIQQTTSPLSDQEAKAFAKRIFTCSYSNTRTLRDKNSGMDVPVIDITVKSEDIFAFIWAYQDTAFKHFRHLYAADDLWCIAIQRPGGEGRQYIVNNYLTSNDVKHEEPSPLDIVSRLVLDKETEDVLSRTTQDSTLPCYLSAQEAIEDWAREVTGLKKEDDNVAKSPFVIDGYRAVREKDIPDFKEAPSYFTFNILYDNINYPADKFQQLCSALDDAKTSTFPFPVLLHIRTMEKSASNETQRSLLPPDFGKEFDETVPETKERENYGCKPGQTLLRFIQNDRNNITIGWAKQYDDSYIRDYGNKLEAAFEKMLSENTLPTIALRQVLYRLFHSKNPPQIVRTLQDWLGLKGYGCDIGNTLLSVSIEQGKNGGLAYVIHTLADAHPEENEKCMQQLRNFFYTYLHNKMETENVVQTSLWDVIEYVNEKGESRNDKPTENNDNDMANENINLDTTNPASSNEAAGKLTTRELLKELKERGVTFQGLEVPVTVRCSVSLDEI